MGQRLSQDCQQCWDPEATAAIIRRKKAQRTAINRYNELLDELDRAVEARDRGWSIESLMAIQKHDAGVQQKGAIADGGDGLRWVREMQARPAWPGTATRRVELEKQASLLG